MYFGLPEDALALRDGLREVLADACTPATIRAAWDGDACDGLWKTFAEFGLLGLLVPEDRGGLELDELSFVAAMEECGYAGVPGPLVETVAYAPLCLLALDGTERLTVHQQGRAEIAYGTIATHIYDQRSGLVHTGFDIEERLTLDRSRRVGALSGRGLQFVSDTASTADGLPAQRATLGTAAFLLGLARRQLDLTVDYLKTRKQFGVAIGTYQGLKHPLADAVVGTEFAWPVVLMAAQALASGAPDAALRVSHAKAAASDAAYRMSRVCLQAHGAIGYTVEYDLHLFAKRTWAMANDWGTSAEHRRLVTRELMS